MRNWISTTLAACFLCASCADLSTAELNGKSDLPARTRTSTFTTSTDYKSNMQDIAARADETVVDGWFYGQDPRFFKSFYRKIPAEMKAEFALAYHNWLSKFNQDLAKDFNSYVPYSKRADFAMEWWSKHEPRFKSEPLKMQVLWVHESIQDAGELWWRAGEKLRPESKDATQTLAHDEEQKMVAQFMEKENSPGRISDQIWKRKQAKQTAQ